MAPRLGVIEKAARDNTEDWLIPAQARPATMAELEQRVDYALTVARASEAAALEIGAAALDAAEQARRAAELAERASARTLVPDAGEEGNGALPTDPDELWLRSFGERADRLLARFSRLESPIP